MVVITTIKNNFNYIWLFTIDWKFQTKNIPEALGNQVILSVLNHLEALQAPGQKQIHKTFNQSIFNNFFFRKLVFLVLNAKCIHEDHQPYQPCLIYTINQLRHFKRNFLPRYLFKCLWFYKCYCILISQCFLLSTAPTIIFNWKKLNVSLSDIIVKQNTGQMRNDMKMGRSVHCP